ncbi:hypothetical protein C8J56DRAFT_884789 [Mycena floridula]|nr:hypothetical protein C8J56DRAFT_884789 [Mycena floridula]
MPLTFPPEILGEIFAQCSSPDAPLIVGAVCQTFRSVATTNPTVWRRLDLSLASSEDSLLDKTRLWLHNAKARRVHLSVDVRDHTELPSRLTELVRSHHQRWQSLDISSSTTALADAFLNAIYSPLAEPQSIALSIASSGDSTNSLPLALNLASIQSLELTNYSIPTNILAGLPQLSKLSIILSLRSAPLTSDAILEMLDSVKSSLVSIEVQSRIVASSPCSPDLHLPLLKRLSLRSNNIHSLFGRLVAPSLQEMKLEDLDGRRMTGLTAPDGRQIGGSDDEMAIALRKALETCGHGITLLDLRGLLFRPNYTDDWRWCARHLPAIRSVRINEIQGETLTEVLDHLGSRGRRVSTVIRFGQVRTMNVG